MPLYSNIPKPTYPRPPLTCVCASVSGPLVVTIAAAVEPETGGSPRDGRLGDDTPLRPTYLDSPRLSRTRARAHVDMNDHGSSRRIDSNVVRAALGSECRVEYIRLSRRRRPNPTIALFAVESPRAGPCPAPALARPSRFVWHP